MNSYRKSLDHIRFSPDFEDKTIARILQQAQQAPPVKTNQHAKFFAIATAIFIVLTTSVLAGRQLLSGTQIAAILGDEKLENALASTDFTPQSVTSGDYVITLHGFLPNQEFTSNYEVIDSAYKTFDHSARSCAVISLARSDGSAITTDSEVYSHVVASLFVQGVPPTDFNIFTQSGNAVYFIEDGVYYYVMYMTGIREYLNSEKDFYIAVYEGFAPQITMESDGSIKFSENFDGIGAIFTIE